MRKYPETLKKLPEKIDINKLFTISMFAEFLGVKQPRVTYLIKNNQINMIKICGHKFIYIK